MVRLSAQQWIMPHPWGNPVTDITFLDDNTGLATVSYDGIYRTTDGGSAWVKVWDTGSENCFMIDFSPSGEAVVACNSYLLYSQDYGNTWSIRGQLTDMHYLKIQLVAPQQLVSFYWP
ncbi:MAG: WD40/YVTN/BNR-like repeat-containing protein [Bacteroidales bacterium]